MDYAEKMEQSLGELCDNCVSGTGHMCDETGCLVGFVQKCMEQYKAAKKPIIKDGIANLPLNDYKMYELEDAAKIIAIACKWCHNCKDEHSEDCIVAICRRAMEFATIGNEFTFQGSTLIYLKDLDEKNPELCQLVMQELQNL